MDINIIIVKPDLQILINKFLIEKLVDNSINIGIAIQEQNNDKTVKLVTNSSFFKLQINTNFILNHYANKSQDYKNLLNELKNIFDIISKNTDKIIKQMVTFSSVSILYKHKKYLLQFPFNFQGAHYIEAFELALKLIFELVKNDNSILEKAIKEVYDEKNNDRVFSYQNKFWKLIDPLDVIAERINQKYRENKDSRIKKPHIMVNKDNIWKYFIFDKNWVLVFDKLETLLVQPNDVSIYSNISEKNLNQARIFYEENILPRHINHYGSFPLEEIQKEYFDYFELIIQAIIFSYTSLEAFANICIPENYIYVVEKDGIKTTYSKEAIERKFSLRDKFKNILKEILLTQDVSKTKWWCSFIKLEDIRNEIVHSKASKSEDRYSKLLEQNIFIIIEIHKVIIQYYGVFISENRKALLNEFPYGFGHDNVFPALMSDKNYEKSYRYIHNIKM